jgi:hexosaminidase
MNIKFLAASLMIVLAPFVCSGKKTLNIVPYPQKVEMRTGSFGMKGTPVFISGSLDKMSAKAAEEFAGHLSTVTGKENDIIKKQTKRCISFDTDASLAREGYKINVERNGVKITASSYTGFLYAIQTIKQMLPVEIYGTKCERRAKWKLPCVSISDKPRFAYRGMHLDCARHFFSVEEVKRYLDIMSVYKLNVFHWHLTDDQGWRIEIKKYPKLTEIGAYRNGTMVGHDFSSNDGIRYGGFYSQEEIKDVINYAAGLGITIIPEIDLPGHMAAALASYPEFGCTGGPYEVWTRWGISKNVLCPGKEASFKFIEDVLTEVMDLFPSEYIHIGGDECPKDSWKECPDCQKRIKELGLKSDKNHSAEQYLQNYVTARVQKFVNDHGKKIIGWDEILEGNPAPGATIMSWRGVKGGIQAANMGFDAIMTPNKYVYFDYLQSKEKDKEPLAIGGYLPVDSVYTYEPYNGLKESARKYIIGVQANLWTEYIATNAHLEYNLLPRLAALSEVQWCNPENKNWERFRRSLKHQTRIYDTMGYVYCKDVFGIIGLPGQEKKASSE